MADSDPGKTVIIDGVTIGHLVAVFSDADDLVEQLRKRAAYIGVSYGVLEDLAGMCEGSVGKYLGARQVKHLTCASLTRIASVLGLKAVLVSDDALVRRNKEHWGQRDARKAHNTGHMRRRAIAEAAEIIR